MHVAIRLTMDEFQYLPGQICDSKLLQRNLAVHLISLMLHTSPRILTAWCRRQYGDPSRFPGVNLASALVSSWHHQHGHRIHPESSPEVQMGWPFLDTKSSIKIAGSGRCQGCLLLATWRLCWQFLSRKSLMSLWCGWQIPNYATSCKKWIKPRNTTQRDPPVGWKRPRFQGDTPKRKGQLGSSYVERDKEKKREREISLMNCWTYCWCRWVPLLWGDL